MNNKTIELHTIATFQGKEYELENLLNGLLNKLEQKDHIINELEKYLNDDDWTSVNGVITIKLIKTKLNELKEGK